MILRVLILIISIQVWYACFQPIILFAGCLTAAEVHCKENGVSDTTLPKYTVEPCLLDIFLDITKSQYSSIDSSNQYYFVVFKKQKNYDFLRITTEYWNVQDSISFDCVIEVNKIYFFVKGDLFGDNRFKQDSVFRLEEDRTSRIVNKEIKPNFDEPSLRGMYDKCPGNAIYIEVYAGRNFPNKRKSMQSQASRLCHELAK